MDIHTKCISTALANSGTGRQSDGTVLLTESELSTLRSGGTPASLLFSRNLSYGASASQILTQATSGEFQGRRSVRYKSIYRRNALLFFLGWTSRASPPRVIVVYFAYMGSNCNKP